VDRAEHACRWIPNRGWFDPDDIRKAISSGHTIDRDYACQQWFWEASSRIRQIGQIARQHGVPFLVDSAQSSGHLPIDVQADNIDLLAAPGHKGLFGAQGTGMLYIPARNGKSFCARFARVAPVR